jgi:phosphocarrier protein FPr
LIGIVIVSHSHRLAAGVLELAQGMAGADVRLATAGGLDLPGNPLGTDAGLVARAIESVYSPDGVLVLMDLGSAVLSAEMALELLPPGRQCRVALCAGPLVEGAVSAAVQARLGSTLDQALAEAQGALSFKAEQLGSAPAALLQPEAPQVAAGGTGTCRLRLMVENRLGLHARPAARLVQTAGRFPETGITVRNLSRDRGPVPVRGINAIATLGVRSGHEVEFEATGARAAEALEALAELAAARFGDLETEAGAPGLSVPSAVGGGSAQIPAGALAGIPGSAGAVIGPVRHFRPPRPVLPDHPAMEPELEWARLGQALVRVRNGIEATASDVRRRSGRAAGEIFEAHMLFLDDPDLLEPARRLILEQSLDAAAAWDRSVQTMAAAYRAMEDDYLRSRAADLLDVGDQVVLALLGQERPAPALEAPGILVALDLTPADTARLDPASVRAICTAAGGPTSHSAILARTFGIPAVVGLGDALLALPEGTPVAVDAVNGWVIPDPDEAIQARCARQAQALAAAAAAARAESIGPAASADGRRMEIGANIGSLAEARLAVAAGAEGVGLLRTEFLYLGRTTAPDEEEQYQAYAAIAQVLDGRPLVIRTLDIGGDKPLPYIDLGQEANPFLGCRALRLCLARPGLFKVQLRAILRVAAAHPVKIMFPMVATLEEVKAAKALLAEARTELQERGVAVPERIETGIMVEIPAAALRAHDLAAEVEFFSIGTNDLTQYTLAAERGNPRVAGLTDALHPAVLELIRIVVEAAHARDRWVGVCGELGGDPMAAPFLLGLGVDELSMNPPAIPLVKQALHSFTWADAKCWAEKALRQGSADQVRALVQ